MKEMNEKFGSEGLPDIKYGIGLHIGNVMFGNVGLPARLAFSVFGAAVNEATRIETLTKTYKTPTIASEEFRSRCEGEWKELGSATLRGLSRPVRLFCPVLPQRKTAEALASQVEENGLSDAENVVLLHQGGIPRERAAR